MLRQLRITGFKSIAEAQIDLGEFNVFFGPNAAGKSNILDAIQALSRLATERTIQDAFSGPVRGNPAELFRFPKGGFRELLTTKRAQLSLGARIDRFERGRQPFNYQVGIEINPETGSLAVYEERLETLQSRTLEPKGSPRIRVEGDKLIIPSGQGRPLSEPLHLNHTKLSDLRYSGSQFPAIDQCRREISGWRVYYLDPRESMRASAAPRLVSDIGQLGENILPFLYRLKRERPDLFTRLRKVVRTIIPGVSDVDVDLDENRGLLEAIVVQNDIEFSLRVVSEGTLRVIAICAAIINPWGGGVIAIEEPENGIQPQRIELMAKMLISRAGARNQIIVNTHSPLFCSAAYTESKYAACDAKFFAVSLTEQGTEISSVTFGGPLFADAEAQVLLKNREEEYVVQETMIRHLFNA